MKAAIVGLVLVILVATTHSVDLNDLQTKLSLHAETPTTHIAGLHQQLLVEFSVRNPTTKTVSFLKYSTPFEGVRDNIFSIRKTDTVSALYFGMKEKKREPIAADFITLGPGEILSTTIDLLPSYRFEEDGEYTVHFSGAYFTANRPQPVPTQTIYILPVSNQFTIFVNNTYNQPPHQLPNPKSLKECTAQQLNDVALAKPLALQESDQALQFLLRKECKKPFVEWFGKKEDGRWNNATSVYTKIVNFLKAGQVPVICDSKECGGSTYAFVYPTDKTHTIYLCSLFWTSPPGLHQFESKPGVIIHESSHFADIGKTNDFAYGTPGARELAKKNPANAVRNADNYEYFCESNPVCK